MAAMDPRSRPLRPDRARTRRGRVAMAGACTPRGQEKNLYFLQEQTMFAVRMGNA